MEEATVETLLALLRNELEITQLAEQLSKKPTLLAVWKKRSKDDWEKYHGLNGVDIYNHLHPKSTFPEALRAKNHVIAGVDVFNHLDPNSTAGKTFEFLWKVSKGFGEQLALSLEIEKRGFVVGFTKQQMITLAFTRSG